MIFVVKKFISDAYNTKIHKKIQIQDEVQYGCHIGLQPTMGHKLRTIRHGDVILVSNIWFSGSKKSFLFHIQHYDT